MSNEKTNNLCSYKSTGGVIQCRVARDLSCLAHRGECVGIGMLALLLFLCY